MSDKARAIEFLQKFKEQTPPIPVIDDENIRILLYGFIGETADRIDKLTGEIEFK